MDAQLKALLKDRQYAKFSAYGFLKNLRFFEPFLVLYLLSKGLSFTEIGVLIGLRELVVMIAEIPSGLIADALGRRRTLASSFVFYMISFIAFFVSQNFVGFMVAMFFFAVGDAFRTGVHKAMIFEYLQRQQRQNYKTDYYGRTRSWSQMGTALSSLLAGAFVVLTGDYGLIFLFSIVPYIADLLLVMSYPKWLDGDTDGAKVSVGERFKIVWKAFLASLKNAFMLRGLTNNAVHSAFYASAKDYLQPLLKALALSLPIQLFQEDEKQAAMIIGLVYFLIYVGTSFMSRYAGNFAKLFNQPSKPLNLTLILGLVAGIVSGFFFQFGFELMAVLFFMVILFNENLRKPIGTAYVAALTDQKSMATLLSVQSQLKALLAAIFAPLIGFLADQFGVGNALIIFGVAVIEMSPFYWVKRVR
ncbi:MAG: MFS transporter [Bacteroidales bacterium]|nr:MFS transporter [Bacteroidales bacterium]